MSSFRLAGVTAPARQQLSASLPETNFHNGVLSFLIEKPHLNEEVGLIREKRKAKRMLMLNGSVVAGGQFITISA